jgi:hypothetical protein
MKRDRRDRVGLTQPGGLDIQVSNIRQEVREHTYRIWWREAVKEIIGETAIQSDLSFVHLAPDPSKPGSGESPRAKDEDLAPAQAACLPKPPFR